MSVGTSVECLNDSSNLRESTRTGKYRISLAKVTIEQSHQCGKTTCMPSSVPCSIADLYLRPDSPAQMRCVTSRVSSRLVWPPKACTACWISRVSAGGSCAKTIR